MITTEPREHVPGKSKWSRAILIAGILIALAVIVGGSYVFFQKKGPSDSVVSPQTTSKVALASSDFLLKEQGLYRQYAQGGLRKVYDCVVRKMELMPAEEATTAREAGKTGDVLKDFGLTCLRENLTAVQASQDAVNSSIAGLNERISLIADSDRKDAQTLIDVWTGIVSAQYPAVIAKLQEAEKSVLSTAVKTTDYITLYSDMGSEFGAWWSGFAQDFVAAFRQRDEILSKYIVVATSPSIQN